MTDDSLERVAETVWRRERRHAFTIRLRLVLLVVLLALSTGALGWGWGYNTRVSQECANAGGVWNTFTQQCVQGDHVVPY